jgi:hypothetical protein
VHCSRTVPPPPLPDPLHCVNAALVVLAVGLQTSVGWVPPPWAALLHSFTVAGEVVELPMMLLTMATVHVTVPPPPLPDPLHWVTDVVSWFEGAVQGMHVGGA